MTAYDMIMINQIAWGVAIFASGMLVGYVLKLVLVNHERVKGASSKE